MGGIFLLIVVGFLCYCLMKVVSFFGKWGTDLYEIEKTGQDVQYMLDFMPPVSRRFDRWLCTVRRFTRW